jgi:hypothetical protein
MRKIPEKLKAEMEADKYYTKCAVGGSCSGKIEWHHNLIYAGRQVNEKFCIIPLCKHHHDKIDYFKDEVDRIMLNRATEDELTMYSKAVNLRAKRDRLNAKN